MATTTLTFHPRCGKNVQVTKGGMKVERTSFRDGYGHALTAHPLRTEETFTLQISGHPRLYFGVTTHSPEEVHFPQYMCDLQGTWCLGCGDEGGMIVNGEVVNKKFLSKATLYVLKAGDTLGLQLTKNRGLHFYVNGKDMGIAATNIPDKVHGFVDLFSRSFPSVKLIPDVQEERLETRSSAADEREVKELQSVLQQREREHQGFQQQLKRQPEGLLKLLQQSEREKHGLQQQLQQRDKEQDKLRQQLHQKEKELHVASSQTPRAEQQTHHTEFWEVSRGDVTLNMQRILGTGGWGYVVEGRFRGQTVAVKCLHDLIRGPMSTAVIRKEIGIMAQLRHPNLVLLIAAVIDEEDPLIITELLDLPLRRAYETNQLDPGESCKLSIFRDVASALNYLHLHHHGPIIHRDVSSANVLLERGQWRAKLSDFGSAKLAREATTTGPGAAVYSAPEMRKDTGIRQSPKVDVYSYGVLVCEVAVGQFPQEGRFPAMMQSLSEHGPLLHRLVSSCTQEHPKDRPSMEAILANLDRALTTFTDR